MTTDLSDNPGIGAEATQLFFAIRDHPRLQVIKLCNINAPSDSTASNAMRSLFANNPRILFFDIHHNYFHHEALCRFFISLREAPTLLLTRLDLDSMGVGSVSMKDLVSTLNRCPQLSFISLRKNAVGGAPLAILLKGLRHNSKLTSLNLARTKLRDSDIRALGDYLRETRITLRELDVSDNNLKAATIDAIVTTWNRNKTLTTLWLGQNELGPNDVSRFLRFVASLNNWRQEYPPQDGSDPVFLSNLDLSDMRSFSGKSQAQDLSSLLASTSANLSRLILVNAGFTPESTRCLISGIKESRTLEFMDIRFSDLGTESMQELAVYYSTSPTLSRILMDFPDSKKLLRTKILPGLHLLEIPPAVLHATHLVKLNLKGNRITSIAEEFTKLVDLVSLDLRDNYLEYLPSQMGWMTHLRKLKLDGNPLRTPPAELRATAGDKPAKILGYLRDLSAGHETIYRAKLMLVGQENVGKTSLLAALRRKLGKTAKPAKSPKFGRNGGTTPASLVRTRSGKLEQFVSTDGIDIHELIIEAPMPVRREDNSSGPGAPFLRKTSSPSSSSSSSSVFASLSGSGSKSGSGSGFGSHGRGLSASWTTTYEKRSVTLSTWDFGGQAIYYSTHQFFLSDQAVFLVCWDLRFDEEASQVGFWLQSIQSRSKGASAIIVGTHADEIMNQPGSSSSGSVTSNSSVQASDIIARKLEAVRQKYRKYSMVKAAVAVNCVAGDVSELLASLVAVLQDLPGMGIPIPSSHLALARFIRQYRQATDSQREEMVSSSNGIEGSPPSSAATSPHASPRSIGPSPTNPHALGAVPNSARTYGAAASPNSLTVSGGIRPPRRTSSQNLLSSANSSPPSARTHKHPQLPFHQQFKHGQSFSSSSSSLSPAAEAFSTPASLPYKTWAEFVKLAKFCNIADGPDLKRCVETLHMMGDVVYFDDPKGGLDDLVILDSQFLTQVMATIITTKQNYVKSGIINFNDLRHIWKPPLFPISIHPLLLTLLQKFEIVFVADDKLVKRLTEYFDVSPAVKNPAYPLGGLGVIPSLLPEEVPALDILWPRFNENVLQFDRIYVFDILPIGLFSRLLFRLLNSATDVLHCWRHGAVLQCSDSLCLVEQNINKQSITVTMRGGRSPSEQLRMMADVVEALILGDTWWRTAVKKRITCPACLYAIANPPSISFRNGFTPRNSDEDIGTSSNNAKGGSSESIRSAHSKASSGEVPIPAPVPYHPGDHGTSIKEENEERGDSIHRTRSTSTSPAQLPTVDSVIPAINASPAFRRGSSFNLRTPSSQDVTTNVTPTKLQRRSQRAIRLSSDSSPSNAAGGSTDNLIDVNGLPRDLGAGSGSGSTIPANAPGAGAVALGTAMADTVTAKGNRRPPSIGQIRLAANNNNNVPKTATSSTTSGSGNNGKEASSFGGSSSSFGGSSIATSSSEHIHLTGEPYYLSVDECIRLASMNQAYITCGAGHLVRLDRVAPDVALVDFERFRVKTSELEVEPEPFAKGSYGLIFRANWTHDIAVKQSRNAIRRSTSVGRRSDSPGPKQGHRNLRKSDPDAGLSSSEDFEISRSRVTELVAVKQIQAIDPTQISRMYDDFAREIWTMSGLVHPNLVNLLGFFLDPMPSMLMEFVDGGDLYSFLHEHDEELGSGEEAPRLPSAVILKIALDIAHGMNFLHSATPAFIHRDLKTPNIMVTRYANDPSTDIAAKVADFGLTNRMVIPLRKEGRLDRAVTNPTWQAPEILREEEFSEKSDTYAYGLILWELYTRRHPYSELNSSFLYEIEDAVLTGMRPTIPADCPEEYSRLIVACWSDKPDERPTFPAILAELQLMIDKSGLGAIIRQSAPSKPKKFANTVRSSGTIPSSSTSSGTSSPPMIPVSAPAKTAKRRRTGSSTSSVSANSTNSGAGAPAKPFRLPPKIDEVASQEMDAPIEGHDVDTETMDSSDTVSSTSRANSNASLLDPPLVSSVATMIKNRNHRAHSAHALEEDIDDSEVQHDDDSRLEDSTSSYHSISSDQIARIRSTHPYTRPSAPDLHHKPLAESSSGSSIDMVLSASTPALPNLVESTSSSSSMMHPLSVDKHSKHTIAVTNKSASTTPGSSASSQPEAPIASRPMPVIPRIVEAETSEEESSSSSSGKGIAVIMDDQGRPPRRNKSSSTESSSSSEDTELLHANPALALQTAAVFGRFAKELHTNPATRLTSIIQVGNSQIWATGRDGSVHVWNAKNGNLVATHPQAHNVSISSAAHVLDTVWMCCPKTSTLGIWYVRMSEQGNRVEKRSGTLNVASLNKDGSRISHWRQRFVVINFKDGSLKIFSSKEGKSSEISFTAPTPTMAPIKELSLINVSTNPVSFGLALEVSQRAFKVTSGPTTLYFEVEQENDMLEWLDCISSIASTERLLCLTKLTNEWTHNIGVVHSPSVKGELLITGSTDAEMLLVSWNVQTKKVSRSTRLSQHLPKLDESTDASTSTSSAATVSNPPTGDGRSSGSRRSSPEPRSRSSSAVFGITPKQMRITAIVTLPKRGHTLVAAGPLIFVLVTKSLEVVRVIRTVNLERPNVHSPILAMALTRPKEIWTASKSGTITAWETSSFTPIARFQAPPSSRIRCIMPVSSSSVWTSGDDGVIRVWDSATHTMTNELSGRHTGPIRSMVIWHHSVWSASFDKSVCIWT